MKGTHRVSHTMINTQTNIRECHTGNILSYGHTVATLWIGRIIHSDRQVLMNHLDSLELEHITHLPSSLGNQALDSVSHRIHTGSCGKPLWQRIHQLSIYDSNGRNIVRIHAYHLLLALLVDNHIVDGCLCCGTSSSRKSYDRQALVLGRSNTLQRNDVGKLRVGNNHADTLCRIHRTATTDSDDEVCLSILASLNTCSNIRNCWVWLYVIKYLVSDVSLVQYVEYHLGNAKFHQALVCYNQSFFPTTTSDYCRKLLAGTWTEIGNFIKNESVYHKCLCLRLNLLINNIFSISILPLDCLYATKIQLFCDSAKFFLQKIIG